MLGIKFVWKIFQRCENEFSKKNDWINKYNIYIYIFYDMVSISMFFVFISYILLPRIKVKPNDSTKNAIIKSIDLYNKENV